MYRTHIGFIKGDEKALSILRNAENLMRAKATLLFWGRGKGRQKMDTIYTWVQDLFCEGDINTLPHKTQKPLLSSFKVPKLK